jgi:cyclophilin family peptidyl-prolyl cis-trans isomerase
MKYIKTFIFASIIIVLAACKNEYPNLEKGIFANIETNKGNVLLKLHYNETPLTVANFVSLAEGTNGKVVDSLKGKKFYNGLPFHRVIPDFMIQGGDIKRNGTGDPGYKFADEFPKDTKGKLKFTHNKKGTLSMANSGPSTNGSQFFITYKETPWLDGKHTVFGEVVEGLSILDSITQGDFIEKVEIIKNGVSDYNASEIFEEALKNKFLEEAKTKEMHKVDSIAFSNKMEESKAELLASGLKILHVKKGNGAKVKEGDRIQVNYTGYFTHGKVFDTSSKRNKPLEFTVGVDRVIEGWTEGVQLIREGGKARLFVPYYLAYGERGYGPIPDKAKLIFDVEIVKINN